MVNNVFNFRKNGFEYDNEFYSYNAVAKVSSVCEKSQKVSDENDNGYDVYFVIYFVDGEHITIGMCYETNSQDFNVSNELKITKIKELRNYFVTRFNGEIY